MPCIGGGKWPTRITQRAEPDLMRPEFGGLAFNGTAAESPESRVRQRLPVRFTCAARPFPHRCRIAAPQHRCLRGRRLSQAQDSQRPSRHGAGSSIAHVLVALLSQGYRFSVRGRTMQADRSVDAAPCAFRYVWNCHTRSMLRSLGNVELWPPGSCTSTLIGHVSALICRSQASW
jgi:hypothetical protein